MKQKIKGVNAERDLVHLFWKNDWAAWRVAGSGSNKYPSPDIIAGKEQRKIIIECKTNKGKKQYLEKEEISDLLFLGEHFHAEPWIGIKFDKQDWRFIKPFQLDATSEGFCIDKVKLEQKGRRFDRLITEVTTQERKL